MIVKIPKHTVAVAVDMVLIYTTVSSEDRDYLQTIRSMLRYHVEDTVDVDMKTFLLVQDELR